MKHFHKLTLFAVLLLSCPILGTEPRYYTEHESPSVRATVSQLHTAIVRMGTEFKDYKTAIERYDALRAQREADGFIDLGNGERLSGIDVVPYINGLFLHLSELRLQDQITRLKKKLQENKFPKEWMRVAERERLKEKEQAWVELAQLKAKVRAEPFFPIIEDMVHLREQLALGSKRLKENRGTGEYWDKLEDVTSSLVSANLKLVMNPATTFEDLPQEFLQNIEEAERFAKDNPSYREAKVFLDRYSTFKALHWNHKRHDAFLARIDGERAGHPERTEEANKFLKALHAEKPNFPARVDHSALFHAPRSQGHLLSCVAHALTSDMGSHLPEEPSANFAFALMSWGQTLLDDEVKAKTARGESTELTEDEANDLVQTLSNPELYHDNMRFMFDALARAAAGSKRIEPYQFANRGIQPDLAESILKTHGIPPESKFKSSDDDFLPKSLQAVADRKYTLKEVQALHAPMTTGELQRLIATQPFQLVISTDARHIEEDWIRPDPFSGSIPHVFNVVGIDEGIDPFDNRYKSYLILRDSFTKGKFHYYASVESLLPLAMEARRVTKVDTLKKPVRYELFPPKQKDHKAK